MKNPSSINILHKTFILLRLATMCFVTFSKSLLRVACGKMTRSIADQYIRQWAQWMLDAVHPQISVIGDIPELPQGRCVIYMSNHASLFDIPICLVSLPGSIRMMAKKELKKIFMFGAVLNQNEFIFINRHDRREAILDLRYAAEKMQSGIALWASPEGTRSRDGQLQSFKKGVFRLAQSTKAVIIPVGIKGNHHLLPAKTWNFSPGEKIEVHIGKPIDTQQMSNELLPLMNHVHDTISQLCE